MKIKNIKNKYRNILDIKENFPLINYHIYLFFLRLNIFKFHYNIFIKIK